MRPVVLVLFSLFSVAGSTLAQQRPPDTMRVDLGEIVVTSERFNKQLSESTSAIATIGRHDLERLPSKTLTDVIALLPGIGFISRDGDGRDGLVTVRGFYGGGDVEYLVVLVDGLPFNDSETGLIAWESIPTANIERIELLRGGSSSLYGDAAIGGVLNIITRAPKLGGRIAVSGGSYQTSAASGYVAHNLAGIPVQLTGAIDRTAGFREDKPRSSGSVNLASTLLSREQWKLTVRSNNSWRIVDLAGPLLSKGRDDEDYLTSQFANDFSDERRNGFAVELSGAAGSLDWRATVSGLLRNTKGRNTLALAPQYADTRNLIVDAKRIRASAAINFAANEFWSIVGGFEAGRQANDSRYSFPDGDSRIVSTDTTALDRSGNADRTYVGAYAQAAVRPHPAVSLTLGIRADVLQNSFESTKPDGAPAQSVSHSAASPKLGVNIELMSTDDTRINAYVSAGTSFKSPALDQLYGNRTITVFLDDIGAFEVSTSNGDLKPQRGTHIEGGIYASRLGRHGRAELSASVYRLDMRDELDVDLATFMLVNIGRSRHDGIELALNLTSPTGLTGFANYTFQSTTFRNGDYVGNFVKAIPRDLYSFGTTMTVSNGLGVGLTGHGSGRTFVDDPNTVQLDNYLTFDGQLSFSVKSFKLGVTLLNILGKEYFATAYPDPSGSDVLFRYPAAGRSIKVGGAYVW